MKTLLVILLPVLWNLAGAQSFDVDISRDHLNKIEAAKDPATKLKKYKRFYQRDSARKVKAWERSLKHRSDSLVAATQSSIKTSQDKLQNNASEKISRINGLDDRLLNGKGDPTSTDSTSSRLALPNAGGGLAVSTGIPSPDGTVSGMKNNVQGQAQEKIAGVGELDEAKELKGKATHQVGQYKNEVGQFAATDSAAMERNKEKAKALVEQQASAQLKSAGIPDGKQYMDAFNSKDSLGSMAKSKGKQLAKNEFDSRFNSMEDLQQYRKEMGEAGKLKEQYGGQVHSLNDSAYMRKQAQEQAEKLATQYLQDHPEIMQPIQKRMNVLMNKYSIVPNSNDLSTAIKRTSLKGKTFKERLVLGANFQIIALQPFTLDASPVIGYRFNTRFYAGVGAHYRHTFGSVANNSNRNVVGYKTFVSYDVIRNYFAYGEGARNSPGYAYADGHAKRIWKNALIIGAGKRMPIGGKVDMTMVVGYNFLYHRPDPIYPQRWVVRIGFQLGERGMLKRR